MFSLAVTGESGRSRTLFNAYITDFQGEAEECSDLVGSLKTRRVETRRVDLFF
jgi:hypothetical protein